MSNCIMGSGSVWGVDESTKPLSHVRYFEFERSTQVYQLRLNLDLTYLWIKYQESSNLIYNSILYISHSHILSYQ